MPSQSDVIIVGGGAIGVCAAYFLLDRGFSITILEQGEIGGGSSYGNAGLIVPSHAIPLAAPGVWQQGLKWLLDSTSPLYVKPRPDPALLRWMLFFIAACGSRRLAPAITVLATLSHTSRALFEQLAALEDVSFDYAHKGGLALYRSPEALAHGVEEAHLLREHGVETQVLNAAAVRAVEPNLLPSIIGGVYFPSDAHLIPHQFVQQMVQAVEARGGIIRTSTPVMHFETDAGRITGVVTPSETFHPREVVLASGAWSPAVVHSLCLRLPIQPAKGYSITIPAPPNAPATPLHFSEMKVVVTPMGDRLRFAGMLELSGFDLSINLRRVESIKNSIPTYLSLTVNLEDAEIWRGLRPLTPDTLPIIGRTRRYENLIVAAGHGMLGISLAPVTGQLVAEIAAGAQTSHDLTLLTPDRFA